MTLSTLTRIVPIALAACVLATPAYAQKDSATAHRAAKAGHRAAAKAEKAESRAAAKTATHESKAEEKSETKAQESAEHREARGAEKAEAKAKVKVAREDKTEGSESAKSKARCTDGTYSHSRSRKNACRGHGGVAEWLGKKAKRAGGK